MTTSEKANTQSMRAYVPTSALARSVEVDSEMIHVYLTDGRAVSAPLMWFPALRAATEEQRSDYQIGAGGRGIHWPQLDEDLSVAGLMAGVDHRSA